MYTLIHTHFGYPKTKRKKSQSARWPPVFSPPRTLFVGYPTTLGRNPHETEGEGRGPWKSFHLYTTNPTHRWQHMNFPSSFLALCSGRKSFTKYKFCR